MNNSIYIQLSAFIYIVLLMLIYFNKRNLNNIENKIYSKLIIVNFFGLIIDILLGILSVNYLNHKFLFMILSKLYLCYFIIWMTLLMYYVLLIPEEGKKIFFNFSQIIIISLLLSSIVVSLPIHYSQNEFGTHSYGLSVSLTYLIVAIEILISIFSMVKNIKHIKSNKYLPLFTFILLGIIVSIIQILNPKLILIPAMETFVTFLMYFTIENPDVKLLTEVYKSKEISDSANDEKNLFIYNMTQEIREITKKVNNEIDYILNSDSITDNKEAARKIKEYTNNFKIVTNDILDVDITNDIKIYNNKYNIKNLFKEIINIYSNKIENKGLSFNINIEHSLPEFLYGDKINFKELLNNVLDYALSETLHGYIELNVNTIIKNDVCRLMISVEDSSTNNNINTITKDNKELYKSYKLAILLNGTMSVLSNPNKNTFKIILDQKIYEEDNIVNKYSNVFNNKKILIVDNVDTTYKIIEKLLKDTNIQLDLSLTSKDCLNKIRSKENYDLIFLEENMNIISSTELIKKLHNERNFNTTIILLTKNNDVEYNNEYKKIGYNYYLLKPIKKENLNDILDEYIK